SKSPLAKSKLGLLQALSFQILEQQPALAALLFPKRVQILQMFGQRGNLPPWTLNELENALLSVVSVSEGTYRFAFLMDGLDECEGDPSAMVELIKQLRRSGRVKLCVSSRNLN